MQNTIKSLYYQMKGISYFVWIPFLVLYILLPAVHYTVYLQERDMEKVYVNIVGNAQILIPLFSVWYILFLLYHLVEQPGCEVLYVTETLKIQHILLLYLFYIIIMIPLFAGYSAFFSEFWWLYVKLCIVNLMYTMFVYAFTYLFRRIIPGILMALFYTAIVSLRTTDGIGKISYFSFELKVGSELFQELIPIIVASLLFMIVGFVANAYFAKH